MKVFYVNLAVSILLIVGGFFVPPIGVIDGSVLSAVGLLLMFAVVEKIPEAIKAGRNIKVQKVIPRLKSPPRNRLNELTLRCDSVQEFELPLPQQGSMAMNHGAVLHDNNFKKI